MKKDNLHIISTVNEMSVHLKKKLWHDKKDFTAFRLEEFAQEPGRQKASCFRNLFYSVWIIPNDSFSFTFNNNPTRQTQPYTLVFTSPFHLHRFTCNGPKEGYVFCFSEYFIQSAFQYLSFQKDFPFYWSNENIFTIPEESVGILKQLSDKIMLEFEINHPLSGNIIRDYLHVFLLEAKRMIMPVSSSIDNSSDYGLFQQFLQLVNNTQPLPRTVDEIAGMLHVTPARLWMTVKKIAGQNPSDIINNRILTEAQSLLLQSGLNVSEIAYHLNFKEKSHFTRFFKNLTGTVPVNYMRQFRNAG